MLWEEINLFVPESGKTIPGRPGWSLRRQLYQNDRQQSQVWLAEDQAHRLWVFKFFHDAGGELETFLDLLRRELELRRKLGPAYEGFVAPIVDFELEPPPPGEIYAPFIALPYYAEGSLANVLGDRNGPLGNLAGAKAERTKLDLVAQVVDHVHQLHLKGVFHGDIRAANILVERKATTSPFVAWLTDLGNGGCLESAQASTEDETNSELTPASIMVADQQALEPEQSFQGYQGMQEVLGHVPGLSPAGGETPSPSRITSGEKASLVASDIAQLGTLLYQCVVNEFDASLGVRGVWQDRVGCPVLRRIIEDAHREGSIASAEDLAERIRKVGMERLSRRLRQLGIVISVLFVVAGVSVGGWWLTAEKLKLTAEKLKLEVDLKVKEIALKVNEERARTQEIIRGGDIAATTGSWDEARSRYRSALGRPDLVGRSDKIRLNERVLRASTFLDDNKAVQDELSWLNGQGNLGVYASAVRLDRAVHELELAMQESASATSKATSHEAAAISLLKQVVDDRNATSADQLTAMGLLADTCEEAEKRFEEALVEDAFHPYATVYLASTALLAGHLEKAFDQARVWELMSRKDPAPLLYQSFALMLLGKRGEADRAFKKINAPSGHGPLLAKETIASYKLLIETVAAIQDQLSEALLDPMGRVKFAWLLVTRLPAVMDGFGQTGVFRVPLTPAQRAAFVQFQDGLRLGHLPFGAKYREAIDRLKSIKSFVPEGIIHFFMGKYYLELGQRAEAAESLERAATLPTLFDVRRVCWLALANHNITLAKKAMPEEALRYKLVSRELIRKAVNLGPMTNVFRTKVIQMLIRNGGFDLAEELAAEAGEQKILENIRRARRADREPEAR